MLVACKDGHIRGFETFGLKKKLFDLELYCYYCSITDLKLVQNEKILDNKEILITCSDWDKSIKLFAFDSNNAKSPISNEKVPLQIFKHSDFVWALLVFPKQ